MKTIATSKIRQDLLCPTLGWLIFSLAASASGFASDLKFAVTARSLQAEQLATDASETKAAWKSSSACREATETVRKFNLQEAPLLADGEARAKRPDALLQAEMKNLELAQNAIKSILTTSPEAQRLVALGQRAATIQANFVDTGKQLSELGKIVLRSEASGVNIGKLEATQQRLKSRVEILTGTVAAEKDMAIKVHNQGILDQASALLSSLDKQIADLKQALESDLARAAAVTGETDVSAAKSSVAAMAADWNRSSDKLRGVADAGAIVGNACNVQPGLPKSVDDIVASAFSNSPSGVSERVRKGFEAVMAHDWNLAKAWFGDALYHDPSNTSIKRFVALSDYNVQDAQQGSSAALPTPSPDRLPKDSDLEVFGPPLYVYYNEARVYEDYMLQGMLKMTENDPVLLRLSRRPVPTQSYDSSSPYEIHN